MPKLTVDGIEVEVPAGATVLQACEAAGKEVPRFCYHERLSIAGNCRMCLVEVKPGPPKPQASARCRPPTIRKSAPTPMVKKAREGVMEFLLINHPLDCPICDQGGECDLQDQSVAYGRGHTRYHENKRAVTEKYMGPIVKTVMTRCIQCTRCVRFAEEVAGVEEVGALYRGENMQITSYLEKAFTSELSGNIVDLCPVGALTSKPYAFEARPWELKKSFAIDVMDGVGTNIRLDSRGRQVLRALPRVNEDVNEEWASDKTRHAVDGLVRRRLDKPYLKKDGKLVPVTWGEAFGAIKAVNAGASVTAIAGDLVDCETMYAAKALLRAWDRICWKAGRRASLMSVEHRGGEFQHDDRRHRDGGRDPADRLQRALGSAFGEYAHPQGREARRQGVRDRAGNRPDLSGRVAGQRSGPRRRTARGGDRSRSARRASGGDRRRRRAQQGAGRQPRADRDARPREGRLERL
jgi:NADH-quinone oxidoreductase subunit G